MTIAFSKEELSEIFSQQISVDVANICVHSKDAKKGDLFLALRGEKTDAHNFVDQAIANGAVLSIVEKDIGGINGNKLIKVESSYEALLKLAKFNLSKSNAKYVGVSGSIGKTSTKNMIYHILSKNFEEKNQVYASWKNFNSQLGLPICAALMPRNAKFGIFEIGMSSFGEISKLINIVPPSISVITSVCEAHREYFNSVWEIAKSKSEIFETKVPQEAAIIPADSPYADFLKDRALKHNVRRIFSFGFQNSDAQIISQEYVENHFSVVAKILGEKVKYEIYCNNDSSISNSVSSILAAHIASGLPLQKLAHAVSSFTPSTKRGESIFLKKRDLIVIDDSYNACPTSMKSAIQSLSKYKTRRKILIIGDMLELGDNSVYYHENLSATIDKFGIDLVFACGTLSKFLFDNLVCDKKGAWRENSTEIAEKVLEEIRDGDCLLVKGSHSMNIDLVVEAIKANMGE